MDSKLGEPRSRAVNVAQRFKLPGPAVALVMGVLLGACATPATRHDALLAPAAAGATILIVRHAEKATDDARDPTLTAAGEQRAARLATLLAAEPVQAVYATAFRRTQATAAPTARAKNLPVSTYDAAMPAADFARRLREMHARGTVLVVAHSNTAPAIASALCDCPVVPMPETEYGRYFRLVPAADRSAPLSLESVAW